VQRVIYLGGLGAGEGLSDHLASRQEVGQILRGSGVPTIELRASIVVGPGSASFETLRALVEALPVIPAPHWVQTAAQPIGVDDLIAYLITARTCALTASRVVEIGGQDQTSYAELMREYARQRRLRRPLVRLPAATLRASRLVLGLLAPEHARIAGAMADSLRNETTVRDPAPAEGFSVTPQGLAAAIDQALSSEDREFIGRRWSQAVSPGWSPPFGGKPQGRRLVRTRASHVSCPPAIAFAAVEQIGGHTGWYALDWFWRLRGQLDRWRGGIGLRRGRRDPQRLEVGDPVDFWRVVQLIPGSRLVLVAEMRIPGRLWLDFDVIPSADGARVVQTTIFDPAGYLGRAYWYLLYPLHDRIFRSMLLGLARAASRPRPGPATGPVPVPTAARASGALSDLGRLRVTGRSGSDNPPRHLRWGDHPSRRGVSR
jgi:hypothetical protein